MQVLKALRTAALAATFAGSALFGAVGANATVLSIGTGWQYDELDAVGSPTISSPWTFTLVGPAIFSITDAFIVGDQYTVSGDFSLVTALGLLPTVWVAPSNPTADAAWADGRFQHGQITLGPGAYSISITGDGVGGIPAGLYIRLDTVPEPATLVLVALGLVAVSFSRRRTSV